MAQIEDQNDKKKKKIYGNPSPFLLESIIKHPSPLNFVLYIMFEPGYSK